MSNQRQAEEIEKKNKVDQLCEAIFGYIYYTGIYFGLITRFLESEVNDGQVGYFILWVIQTTLLSIIAFCNFFIMIYDKDNEIRSSIKAKIVALSIMFIFLAFDVVGFVLIAKFCQNKLNEYKNGQNISCIDYFKPKFCDFTGSQKDFITAQDDFYMINYGIIGLNVILCGISIYGMYKLKKPRKFEQTEVQISV